ncbi:MAG TPA: hypothetical protein VGH28_04220 [Polyangiaceae bacterium]|jgi:hypothetical protein
MRIESLVLVSAILLACGDGGETPAPDGGPAAAQDAAPTQDVLQPLQDAAQDAQGDAQTPTGLAAFDPPYPRIASFRIGGSQTYGAAFQTWASKQAVVVIGGNWEGWNSSGRNREAVVESIKSQSTLGTKVLQYGDCDAIDSTQPTSTWRAQVDANNWYLYKQGTSGAKETNFYSANFWQTNSTTFVTPDSNGHTIEDAFAIYVDATYRTGKTTNAAKSLDGHYHDNVLFITRTDGDFNRDGTTDVAKDYGLAWRTGLRRYFDQLAKIDPNLVRFGNIDDMSTLGITDPKDTAAAAPLDGIMHGALLEGFMGGSWSNETWAGWTVAMNEYRFRMNMTIAPHLAIAGHKNVAANGSDPSDATPYRAMRYGMASASLEDGYYAYSPTTGYTDTDLYSFDELGGNTGGPPVGYLGYPTEAPPTAAWKQGVWRRDFDHGIVLVNPKGNGAQTVSLGGTFKHLVGKQNPSVNDGSSVTSVTLADRDGLVLMK